MINPQLLEYVRTQRAAGLSKEAITQAVAAGGWSVTDVTEAFMALDGVKTPPPPPPPAPFPPTGPRTVIPPTTPIQSPTPIQPQTSFAVTTPPIAAPAPTPAPTFTPRPATFTPQQTATVGRKSGIGAIIAWSLLIVVFVCIGALAVFVYFNPTLVASFMPQLL